MLPQQIEEKSFQLIEERVPSHPFNEREWTIVRRMIHATVDFDLVHTTTFHPEALSRGIAALRAGAPIITDTRMVKAGISLKRLRQLQDKDPLCHLPWGRDTGSPLNGQNPGRYCHA